MRSKLFISIFLLFIFFSAFAQKDEKDYSKRAQEVQKEIWNSPAQPFTVTSVPSTMDTESAVIIATSFEVINSAKTKLKLIALSTVQRVYYQTTFHERVKINDKAALEDYSTIEYQKRLDKTVSAYLIKVYNTLDTYVGAKIIKPDGKEIIVNTGEEVLTKDEDKRKEGKLAISDLQVGDILDYYMRVEKLQEMSPETQGPYTFFLGEDHPILYQSLRLQLDERTGVEYVSANGAPALTENRDNDDNIILSLEQKDLPKLEKSMWALPYRQYPYISLQYMFVTKANERNNHFKSGEVKHGSLSNDLVAQFRQVLESSSLRTDYTPYNTTATYFGGAKNIKEMPHDTLVKILYEAWRHETFCSFSTQDIDVNNNVNYVSANSLINAIYMSRMLRSLGITHEIVLVCPRTSNKLKDVMNLGDFEALIHLKAGQEYWLAFNDIVTQFNEVPARLQGEEGLVFTPDVDAKKLSYEQTGHIRVPVAGAEKNVESETISVAFNGDNMQQLKIDRATELSGAMRHYTQKELMLMEDMEAGLATSVNEKKLTDRLAEDKRQKKLVDEFSAAFAKEKTNQKSYFEDEIEDQYDQSAKELTAYEIKNQGMFNSDFVYRTSFTMDNFVKKAGNNYIVEAGKLIGSVNKVDEKDRTRTIDVYMPYTRTFSYNITLSIPKGYRVKGLENFTRNVKNETGFLNSTATSDDSAVHLKIEHSYFKIFEPASNWPKLLELMDGFYDISNQKLLLEKGN